jgi:hypothetical protein
VPTVWFPSTSVAVHAIRVTPIGKTLPAGTPLRTSEVTPTLSDAVAVPSVESLTTVVALPESAERVTVRELLASVLVQKPTAGWGTAAASWPSDAAATLSAPPLTCQTPLSGARPFAGSARRPLWREPLPLITLPVSACAWPGHAA